MKKVNILIISLIFSWLLMLVQVIVLKLQNDGLVENAAIIRAQEFNRGYSHARNEITDGITYGALSKCLLEGVKQ